MYYRLIHLLFFAVILVSNGWAQEDTSTEIALPFVSNLQTDGTHASKKQLPIMIMFVSDECPFCLTAKEDYIIPMIISGEYEDKVIIRLVDIDSSDLLTDFHGNKMTMETFSNKQKINFTPYVKFFTAEGTELVKPIIGISNKDYYGVFLDDAIESAGNELKK